MSDSVDFAEIIELLEELKSAIDQIDDDGLIIIEVGASPRPVQGLLMPFIGTFSSGKSSLINALLGEALLSTDITPETALPVELRYGPEQVFTIRWPDGSSEEISEDCFAEANFSQLAHSEARLELRLPQLQSWPDLVLVDLPGWASGQSEHERHVDEYLRHLGRTHLDSNILYVIAVSADEGTLRDNLRERLQQLDLGNASYLLVLTKADKRSAADLHSVSAHVAHLLTATLGKSPEKIILTSARKNNVNDLKYILDTEQENVVNKRKTAANRHFLLKLLSQQLAHNR